MTKAERKILPVFNRCAIFSTTDYSYHGHPTPLTCPPDRSRKSIATYYYSNGRPEEEASDSHSTIFRQRPDAPVAVEANGKARGLKSFLHAVTPPFIVDAYKSLKK
jgi:hypothetical protein